MLLIYIASGASVEVPQQHAAALQSPQSLAPFGAACADHHDDHDRSHLFGSMGNLKFSFLSESRNSGPGLPSSSEDCIRICHCFRIASIFMIHRVCIGVHPVRRTEGLYHPQMTPIFDKWTNVEQL